MRSITGRVIHGKKEARGLGYPTANIDVLRSSIDCVQGVYAAQVRYCGKTALGALCIMDMPERVEVHVIGEEGLDLYGETITIRIIEKVGEIVPFTSIEQMQQKIAADIRMISERFGG